MLPKPYYDEDEGIVPDLLRVLISVNKETR